MADLITMLSACGATEGEATDAEFQNTVLLLHGDGTNGAQNNTFLDSSTNNFTITRNGNTTQGSFSPFSKPDGGWGNYFDGSGDNLSVAANAAFQFGTGDFCVETWAYITNTATAQFGRRIFSKYAFVSGDRGMILQILRTSGNSVEFYIWNSSGAVQLTLAANPTLVGNTWYHFAVARSGANASLYINGTRVATTSSAGSADDNYSTAVTIGSQSGAPNDTLFQGYLSNARLVKGSSVYDPTQTTITVPTTSLTAIANTSLLTCQSNRFIDNSSNNFTITRNGDVKVTPFSPFPITTAYDPAVNGGSGYFDGSGDTLSLSSNAAFGFSTNDWTVELWWYPNTFSNGGVKSSLVAFATSNIMNCHVTTTGYIGFYTGAGDVAATSNPLTLNAWHHLAWVRNSGTIYMYVNGVLAHSFADTVDYGSSRSVYIGANTNGNSEYVNGYIANLRVVKGTAVYTSAFTPPTAPLTAIANTSLLTNFTNAGIFDNTGFNNLETVGNAQIDTTVKKYGTGAMKFDGTGDGLFRPPTQDFDFGTGNFTIEWWMYFTSKSGYQTIMSYGYTPDTSTGWLIQTGNGDGKIVFYKQTGGTTIASDTGSTVNTGEWYHIAVVRNSGTTTIYRNGTSVGSGADTNNYVAPTANFYLGGGSSTVFNNFYFNGYIDDLRITKGIARYTTAFTPPTAAFPDIGE